MLRGEIWTYRPVLERPGQSLLRLILSADSFNQDHGRVQVISAHVVADRDPGGLLAVPLDRHGWVLLPTIEATIKRRLDERVGVASAEEMEAVDLALSALLHLGG